MSTNEGWSEETAVESDFVLMDDGEGVREPAPTTSSQHHNDLPSNILHTQFPRQWARWTQMKEHVSTQWKLRFPPGSMSSTRDLSRIQVPPGVPEWAIPAKLRAVQAPTHGYTLQNEGNHHYRTQ